MRNIKLTIEYDGTRFKGWQIQPLNQRTIQGEITLAAEKLFHKKIKLIGSGRTDTGVHAKGQVANFKISTDIPIENIKSGLNHFLPKDIVIKHAIKVPDNFHAQYSPKSKTYGYTILNQEERSAIHRNTALVFVHKLNLSLMRSETTCLIGKHDFKSFQASDLPNKMKSTVRTIKKLDIIKKGDFITIEIEGDGFLYKMVRNIVGTLLEIGSGQLPKGSMQSILSKKDRNYAGITAPAHGLSLTNVEY